MLLIHVLDQKPVAYQDLYLSEQLKRAQNAEISFVELLLDMDLYSSTIVQLQLSHIQLLESNINNILNKIEIFQETNFNQSITYKILNCCETAMQITRQFAVQNKKQLA